MRRMLRSALVLGLVGGCWAAPTKPVPARAAPSLPQRGPDDAAASADPLGFIPADATLVLSLDVAQLRQQALWMQYEPKLVEKLGTSEKFARACRGLLAGVESFTVGFSSVQTSALAGVMVVRGLERGRFAECLKHADATFVPEGAALVSHGTLETALQFADSKTLVVRFGGKQAAKDLGAILEAGTPLRSVGAFADLFREIDVDRALWFVMIDQTAFTKVAVLGHLEAMFGTFDLRDFMSANLHVRLTTAADAATLNGLAQGQLGSVKPMVDRLDVSVADRDLVVEVAISETQLTQLLALAGLVTP